MMRARRTQRGFGLFDAVIALAMLGFGLLTLTRFQGRQTAESTEAGHRLIAAQLAEELLDTMLIDTGNAACYTLPQSGTCGSTAATTRANEWKTKALAGLPGSPTATSALDTSTSRMTVTLTWTGKDSGDTHTHQVITDVRGN